MLIAKLIWFSTGYFKPFLFFFFFFFHKTLAHFKLLQTSRQRKPEVALHFCVWPLLHTFTSTGALTSSRCRPNIALFTGRKRLDTIQSISNVDIISATVNTSIDTRTVHTGTVHPRLSILSQVSADVNACRLF